LTWGCTCQAGVTSVDTTWVATCQVDTDKNGSKSVRALKVTWMTPGKVKKHQDKSCGHGDWGGSQVPEEWYLFGHKELVGRKERTTRNTCLRTLKRRIRVKIGILGKYLKRRGGEDSVEHKGKTTTGIFRLRKERQASLAAQPASSNGAMQRLRSTGKLKRGEKIAITSREIQRE